jgi:hypothetical protein
MVTPETWRSDMQTLDFNPHIQEDKPEEPQAVRAAQKTAQPAPKVLGAGEWLRAVSDFRAPFGFDRLPTVWG